MRSVYMIKYQTVFEDLKEKNEGYKKIIKSMLLNFHNIMIKAETLNRTYNLEGLDFSYSRVMPYTFTSPHLIEKEVNDQFFKACQEIYSSYKKAVEKIGVR